MSFPSGENLTTLQSGYAGRRCRVEDPSYRRDDIVFEASQTPKKMSFPSGENFTALQSGYAGRRCRVEDPSYRRDDMVFVVSQPCGNAGRIRSLLSG